MKPSRLGTVAALAVVLAAMSALKAAEPLSPTVQGRTIAYQVTQIGIAIYQTPDHKECPGGLYGQAGTFPRPDSLPMRRLLLKIPPMVAFPETFSEMLPSLSDYEAAGPTAFGFNLDGKVTPEDYTSPEGEPGIDNQLYRILGCIDIERNWSPIEYKEVWGTALYTKQQFDRFVLELTGVDDLKNDPEVTVTTYRGLDPLVRAGTDTPVAGRTQRVDYKRGGIFVNKFRGKIVDGVLTTEPGTLVFPYYRSEGKIAAVIEELLDARMRLTLTPNAAEGLFGGYHDIIDWYERRRIHGATPDRGEFWEPVHRLADAYPDKNGQNTAISVAYHVLLVQTFLQHP